MIGYGFMGAAHSQAWNVAPRFFDQPARPDLAVLAGRDAQHAAVAAAKFGWASSATDWREAAIANGTQHRASGELAFHVLEIMEGILASSSDPRVVELTSSVDRPAPVPLGETE